MEQAKGAADSYVLPEDADTLESSHIRLPGKV